MAACLGRTCLHRMEDCPILRSVSGGHLLPRLQVCCFLISFCESIRLMSAVVHLKSQLVRRSQTFPPGTGFVTVVPDSQKDRRLRRNCSSWLSIGCSRQHGLLLEQ